MIDHLIREIIEKQNPSVVGLDTKLDYVPEFLFEKHCRGSLTLESASHALLEFNRAIIDAVYEHIPAVKIQIAYYEMYGVHGLEVFEATSKYAREKGLVVIGDVKRNDIGSTAEAYSAAYLGETVVGSQNLRAFDMDFITVNPYFGIDGIQPFVNDCMRFANGIFVLVKTSNPSSGDIQDLQAGPRKVYEWVAQKVNEWGSGMIGERGYSSIGAVVGGTYPEQSAKLRKEMPQVYFLVPGYGAQGGGIKEIMGCFNPDGLGAVINASRSVICAYQRALWKNEFAPRDFAEAARAEVLRMKDEICFGLKENGLYPW